VAIIDSTIPTPNGNNWVIGNPMQYGYYRVNYDDRNWRALIEQLKSDHGVKVYFISLATFRCYCNFPDFNVSLKIRHFVAYAF
jgi:hypothetical protein